MNTLKEFVNQDIPIDQYYEMSKNIYNESYFIENNYHKRKEDNNFYDHLKFKLITGIFPDAQKILIGGAAQGYLISVFLKNGYDCYGFDPLYSFYPKSIESICCDDVKSRMLPGFCEKIPFSSYDNFDLFFTCDVLEHIPQNVIPLVSNECKRMNFKNMIHIIGASEDLKEVGACDGHLTFKSKKWWSDIFQKDGFIDKTEEFLDQKYWPIFGPVLPGGVIYENSSSR